MGICQSSHSNEKQKPRNYQSHQMIQVKQEEVQSKEIRQMKRKISAEPIRLKKKELQISNFPLTSHYSVIPNSQIKQEIKGYQLGQIVQDNMTGQLRHLNQVKRDPSSIYYSDWLIKTHFDNPHIVQVVDILEEKRFLYIIDEFCPDGPLKQFVLGDQILEEQFTSQICAQILSCLDYIQSCQLNHNRLSLESFYLCNTHLNVLVKLVDYRNLYEKDNLSKQNIRFCAPEMLSKQNKYQIESDIWSLGIIAYELLSGKSPYLLESQTLNEISSEILQQQKNLKDINLEVSESCKQFLQSVLRCDIHQRPTIKECMKMPWIVCGMSLSKKYSKLLYNLSKAQPISYLQQCILIIIIDVYELELKHEIELIFHKFAQSNQDEINKQELREMFQSIFQNKNVKKISEQVFNKLDTDKDGQITLQEFVLASVNKSQIITELRIKNIYNELQQGGFIKQKSIFKKVEGDKDLIKQNFKELSDHKLTYDQFKQLVHNVK